jgi:hypothetical protein
MRWKRCAQLLPFLYGTIRLDVNDITDSVTLSVRVAALNSCRHELVLPKIGGQLDHALLPEVPGEGILQQNG